MKTVLLFICFGLCAAQLRSQGPAAPAAQRAAPPAIKTENLLLIGWDGVRWQEIFTGVDSSLMN